MHITHLISSVGPQSFGLGPVALYLTAEQHNLSQMATIWSLDSTHTLGQIACEHKLPMAAMRSFPVRGPGWFGYSPTMLHEISSKAGEEIDILHQHGIWVAISIASNRWRHSFNRPTVLAPHGTLEAYALKRSSWKKRLALLAYERKNLFSATCLHATSEQEADSIRRFGLTSPIAVIPNGIPHEWLSTSGDATQFRIKFLLPTDRRIALFLSRIHPIKGLPLLLKAIARLTAHMDQWIFVIAGPDEVGHQHELELLARELNIQELVRFIGPLFGRDKLNGYAAAEIFILPTLSENFGIVVIEALGAGVPVLTTKGAPWRELVANGCGWWTDITVESIQKSLYEAIALSTEELGVMGEKGRALVAERYTWRRIADMTIHLYEWLLGKRVLPDFVKVTSE